MKRNPKKIAGIALLVFFTLIAFSQNEANKWYFGQHAGLDFNTNPPGIITTSSMGALWSSASMADASGNLLFYTDGGTVWDHTDAVMANGTGLNGTSGSPGYQQIMILKKPGSSFTYYIFTIMMGFTGPAGLFYSEVDMSLASGNGSVTVKNSPIYTVTISSSTAVSVPTKITATKHCNGTDIWLVSRDYYMDPTLSSNTVTINNNFRSFLVTSTGITTTVVSSPITYTYSNNFSWGSDLGCMKISPNGKKLGVAIYNYNSATSSNNGFELFDFDNITGAVSNSLSLISTTSAYNYNLGVEFSSDGTKLYGSKLNTLSAGGIFQWDLCAGSPTAVVASIYTVATYSSGSQNFGALQRASNGKIYAARYGQTNLDVIQDPNALGSACNYSASAQSIGTSPVYYSLPNFMGGYSLPEYPPTTAFTVTPAGCMVASFSSAYAPGNMVGCAASGYTVNNMVWFFGDPGSGGSNTSTATNPFHIYSATGTYTATLLLYYNCSAIADTIRQVVNMNTPCISVYSGSVSCSTLGSATVNVSGSIGPFSYTWMPTAQNGSVATGLGPGTYTVTIYDFGTSATYTTTTALSSFIPFTGSVAHSNSVACNGATTGTANVTGISGGSGSQSYLWTNGVNTYTVPTPANLSAGTWSLSVTDDITSCSINNIFTITQPSAQTLSIAAPTTCAGTSVTLTGIASGGSPNSTGPAYSYSWTGGPLTNSWSVSQSSAGNYNYTLTSKDANNCSVNNTINATFIANPVLSISNVSICPLQTATLSASGATSYSWATGSITLAGTGTFTDNPLITNGYTVTGSALSCTSVATASIVLKPVPVPTLSSNSPVCEGQVLQLQGGGGTGFYWTGPQSFTSSLQNPVITTSPNNTGTYNATVTAANSCTASASVNATVNPLPVILVSGNNSVCIGSVITQTVSGAGTYSWSNGATTTTVLLSPTVTSVYTVSGTDIHGCTGVASETITANPLPTIAVSGNSAVCAGSSLTLTASGASSYSWNAIASAASIYLSPATNTVYIVNGADANGCLNVANISITVNPLPLLVVTGNTFVCIGSSLTQTISGASSYSWSTGALTNTVLLSPQVNTVYIATGTDTNGCMAFVNSSITVNPLPVLTTSLSSAVLCLGETATISVNGGIAWHWNTGATTNNLVVTPTITTTYSVTGTDVNGCSSATMVIQKVDECLGIKMHEQEDPGFTVWPNPGNGIFNLTLNSPENSFNVEVYDVLGVLIKRNTMDIENTKLDLGDTANGIYYIVVSTQKYRHVAKVIKE